MVVPQVETILALCSSGVRNSTVHLAAFIIFSADEKTSQGHLNRLQWWSVANWRVHWLRYLQSWQMFQTPAFLDCIFQWDRTDRLTRHAAFLGRPTCFRRNRTWMPLLCYQHDDVTCLVSLSRCQPVHWVALGWNCFSRRLISKAISRHQHCRQMPGYKPI